MDKQNKIKLTDINQLPSLYSGLEGNSYLYLKPKIKFKQLGGSWEIIQFFCSWERMNNNASIILDDKLNIENLDARSVLLLSAFFLSEEVIHKNENIRKDLLSKFIPFVENMNSPTISQYFPKVKKNKAREINFLCLGGAKNEFLKLFYDNKEFKSKKNIENLIESIFILPCSSIQTKKFPVEKLNGIKEIIYEAFNNADKHGSRDIQQQKIPKNIRAIDMNIVQVTKLNMEPFIEHHKHYKEFLKNVKQLLVISIFDNGEGIVKKYKETTSTTKECDMSFDEKRKVLEEVFLPGVSSSKTPNSGMGLTYIENCVKDLHGILSISTGTLKLTLTPEGKKIIEIAPRVGTLMTILIPIKLHESKDDL